MKTQVRDNMIIPSNSKDQILFFFLFGATETIIKQDGSVVVTNPDLVNMSPDQGVIPEISPLVCSCTKKTVVSKYFKRYLFKSDLYNRFNNENVLLSHRKLPCLHKGQISFLECLTEVWSFWTNLSFFEESSSQ
jgi:hypothetical protein